MALPTPGNVTPMNPDLEVPSNTVPALDQAQQRQEGTVPPLPGAEAAPPAMAVPGMAPPPLPGTEQVNQSFHQPAAAAPEPPPAAEEVAPVVVYDDPAQGQAYPTGAEMAEATVVDTTPPQQTPPPAAQQQTPPPAQQVHTPPQQTPPPQQAAPAQVTPPPAQQTPPPQTQAPVQQAVPQQMPPQQMAPAPQQTAPATQPPGAAGPAGSLIAGPGGIAQALVNEGFEGLEMGFGSFPVVRLQESTFSTSDGDNLGNTFVCILHGSRKKWLCKCEDSNDAEEFIYSYDQVNTTGNRLVTDVLSEWAAKGWTSPVWKQYTDVTAQMVDLTNRELGGVVILSIPHTSNSRLSGYITTLCVKGRHSNQVITQVYPGQRVTSGKFPFHPWAFKEYALVKDIIGV